MGLLGKPTILGNPHMLLYTYLLSSMTSTKLRFPERCNRAGRRVSCLTKGTGKSDANFVGKKHILLEPSAKMKSKHQFFLQKKNLTEHFAATFLLNFSDCFVLQFDFAKKQPKNSQLVGGFNPLNHESNWV